MKLNKMLTRIFVLGLIVLLSGCADVTPVQACLTDDPYGFWGGLWHGIVAPVSFIGSIFIDSIAVYAINNTGTWYDFGFVLGAGILSVGVTR